MFFLYKKLHQESEGLPNSMRTVRDCSMNKVTHILKFIFLWPKPLGNSWSSKSQLWLWDKEPEEKCKGVPNSIPTLYLNCYSQMASNHVDMSLFSIWVITVTTFRKIYRDGSLFSMEEMCLLQYILIKEGQNNINVFETQY